MANGSAQPDSAVATYRVLRELGRRSQRSYAAARGDGTLVVLHRFARVTKVEAGLVTAEEMAVLLRDARCLAKNWHPNIARVRHVDLGTDVLDVATELVEGVTLEELLALARARRVHPAEPILSHAILARIYLDVLAGLSALHALRDGINAPLGAFHGELCPANVVVGKDGVARVVSVLRPRPVTITARSEALGYASPETIAAEVEQDARVDIYSVGVMLWETLMERRLYDETSPGRIAQRQREEDIPSPNARLAEVAMRALAFDPALRFRAAQDMASDIRALAGTVAQGSLVAQLVNELAGERIRARRAELDPHGRHRSLAPPARSGSYARAETATVEARGNLVSEITPSVPPAVPTGKRGSGPVATVSGEVRALVPSAPDLETSYAPRPLPPRHALPPPEPPTRPSLDPEASSLPLRDDGAPFSVPPPSSEEDDDDLPGPRESTPDDAYLEQLAAAIHAAKPATSAMPLDVVDLVEDDDVDDNAITIARDVSVSERSVATAPPAVPPPASASPPAPSFPEIDQLTTPLATPRAMPAAEAAPPIPRRLPSTRTPFVVDVVPEIGVVTKSDDAPARRRFLPLAIAAAAAAIVLGVIGATIVSRASQDSTPVTATPANDPAPPSTVVVPPPPVVDPLPHAASAVTTTPGASTPSAPPSPRRR